jgi:3-hydroxybutyryl-CoA dehydrogenase
MSTEQKKTQEERIAVIGAGLMGHGIAQHFAANGYVVSIYDPVTSVLERVPERVRANLHALGRDESPADEIHLEKSIAEVTSGATIVFEAVLEDLPLKQKIFVELAASTNTDCILASNTSVIPIGAISANLEDGARVVGTHWWNPPYLIPLVEVVQSSRTSASCVERTMTLLRQAGKMPVHVKRDVPGFVGNRLQHALWREAVSIVQEGICDANTVDLVVKNSFGMRLPLIGPLEGADLIGLDLTLAIHRYLFPDLNASPEPSPLLVEKVERNQLGMKSGRGFFEWTAASSQSVRDGLLEYLGRVTSKRQPKE